jgi:hypothetical protein
MPVQPCKAKCYIFDKFEIVAIEISVNCYNSHKYNCFKFLNFDVIYNTEESVSLVHKVKLIY